MKTHILLSSAILLSALSGFAENIGHPFTGTDKGFSFSESYTMMNEHKAALRNDHIPGIQLVEDSSKAIEISTPIEEEKARKIEVFPNPCIFSMRVTGANEGDELFIINAAGQVMLQMIADQNDPVIDVSFLDPGWYIIGVKNSRTIDKIVFTK